MLGNEEGATRSKGACHSARNKHDVSHIFMEYMELLKWRKLNASAAFTV